MFKCTSASEWKVGDRGKTVDGYIAIVTRITSDRYLLVDFDDTQDHIRKVYIPAHGDIEKLEG